MTDSSSDYTPDQTDMAYDEAPTRADDKAVEMEMDERAAEDEDDA